MLERVVQRPTFHVRCLGTFRMVETEQGTEVTPAARKARALVAYLCLAKEPVTRERLAALLWGDRGDEQARASVRQALHDVRSTPGGDRLLRSERDTLAIGGAVSTDFEQIEAAAHSGDLETLAEALAGWRGDIFEDLSDIDLSFDLWLQAERVRVTDRLIAAASEAARAGMARGERDGARKVVNLLQQRDGTNESVLRLGLTLDSLSGDSAGLHRRYENFRELLRSELNAAPSAETQRLFRELASPAESRAVRPLRPDPIAMASSLPLEEDSHPPADASEYRRPQIRTSTEVTRIVAVAVLMLITAALAWSIWRPVNQRAAPPQPLLAVLPFQNLSADAGTRYFSDGMTEEIVGALLRTTHIRVAAPASSFRLRRAGAPEAAKALAATHVLSGSVQRSGNRVHVVAQLTDVGGNGIWSRTYDRTIAEIPALQQDIAIQIADALDMRLSPGALAAAQQVNALAYDHYLRGRDLFLQRDPYAALPELLESIRLAPRFAKAWSTLAEVRFLYANYTLFAQENNYNPAMQRDAVSAAKHALALDPKNGEALAVQAMTTPMDRLVEIDRLFARALQAEPNNTQILNWHEAFLRAVGRRSEAVGELTRAYELDRLTPAIAWNFAVVALLEAGRFGEFRRIFEMDRENRNRADYFELGADYHLSQHDWRGLADYLAASPNDLWPGQPAYFRLARETAAALAAGDRGKFAALSARWRDEGLRYDVTYAVSFKVALGDVDGALGLIEAAVSREERFKLMRVSGWDVLFDPNLPQLRRNPRVPGLLAKWGLFDYWRATNHWPDFCYEPGLPFDCKAEAAKFMRARHS